MFFDQIMNVFKCPEAEVNAAGDLRMATAILLLEAAHQDAHFDPAERATIERLLTERFALSQGECARLMAASEAASARTVQLYPHTQAVFQHMTPEERVGFVEMLWEVVYADGVLDPEEDALIRKLGALIYVTDRERMLAKKRVLEKMGKS